MSAWCRESPALRGHRLRITDQLHVTLTDETVRVEVGAELCDLDLDHAAMLQTVLEGLLNEARGGPKDSLGTDGLVLRQVVDEEAQEDDQPAGHAEEPTEEEQPVEDPEQA
jgi:hypothetical protein